MRAGLMAECDKRLCVAVIAGAHGIGGAVKVKTFTSEPESIGSFAALTDDSGQAVSLRVERVQKGVVIARIEGVRDRTGAEGWKGRELYVARDALPGLDAEEFYHADLLGLRVEGDEGADLGRVVAIHDYGAGDLLDIETADGKTLVLPFTKAVVPVIDLAGGRIVVAPPPEMSDGSDR